MVVDCFTLSTQGIEGAAMIAKKIQRYTGRDIAILPVPMRIDHSREDKVEAGMDFAARQFAGLPDGMSDEAATPVLGRGGGAVPAGVRL